MTRGAVRAVLGGSGRRRGWARSRGAIGVAVVVVALVAGCTNGAPGPTPQPTAPIEPSPSATAQESPTPTPTVLAEPVRPPEMDRVDEVGAMAAAGYFMDLEAYAFTSGDLERWNEISGQTCEYCLNTRVSVEQVYQAGGRYTGGQDRHTVTGVLGYDEQLGVYAVDVQYETAESAQLDAAGSVVSEFDAESGHIVLDVVPATRGWILVEGSVPDGSSS